MAEVRPASYRFVPSEIQLITNTLESVVPVANVPVDLKPVPNVIVLDVIPVVKIINVHLVPAGGTVSYLRLYRQLEMISAI